MNINEIDWELLIVCSLVIITMILMSAGEPCPYECCDGAEMSSYATKTCPNNSECSSTVCVGKTIGDACLNESGYSYLIKDDMIIQDCTPMVCNSINLRCE